MWTAVLGPKLNYEHMRHTIAGSLDADRRRGAEGLIDARGRLFLGVPSASLSAGKVHERNPVARAKQNSSSNLAPIETFGSETGDCMCGARGIIRTLYVGESRCTSRHQANRKFSTWLKWLEDLCKP